MPTFLFWGCVYSFCCADLFACFLKKLKLLCLLVEENALFCSEDSEIIQAYRGSQITKNNAS